MKPSRSMNVLCILPVVYLFILHLNLYLLYFILFVILFVFCIIFYPFPQSLCSFSVFLSVRPVFSTLCKSIPPTHFSDLRCQGVDHLININARVVPHVIFLSSRHGRAVSFIDLS